MEHFSLMSMYEQKPQTVGSLCSPVTCMFFQKFSRLQPLAEVQGTLQRSHGSAHKWDKTNRVSFDPTKGHLVVLHPVQFHGPAFKFLGCMVDTDLRTQIAVDQLMIKINPKIIAILRI